MTFLVREAITQPRPIFLPADTASFEFDWRYMEAACSTPGLELTSGFQITSRKIRSVAERLLLATCEAELSAISVQMLWLTLARSVAAVFGKIPGRPGDAWLNPHALLRVVELVEAGIADELPVEALAAAAGLSSSAFLRAFRGSTGMTPGDYLLERRTSKGAELLTTIDLPVSVIARHSGFRSGSHFATAFAGRRGLHRRAV